ncbi:MAG: hypothetical protein ACK5U7_07500 [Bacteroidota bacterium]
MITLDPRTRKAQRTSPAPKEPLAFEPDSGMRGPSPFFSAGGEPLRVDGMYRKAVLFLICSGPSLSTLDLAPLRDRGRLTMAVNNAWLRHRPDFWVGVDNPAQFADTGWRDPGVLKFVPAAHLGRRLRTWSEGEIKASLLTPRDCPGVVAFRRHDGYDPATFLDLPVCGWGTLKGTKCALGIKGARSVMTAALWIAVKLGFTTINLLGCDFHMPPEGDCYAFGQDKHERGRASNNRLYRVLNQRLTSLTPYLKSRRIQVWNANPSSGLTCFPHKPYAQMLEESHPYCRTAVPEGGWYK